MRSFSNKASGLLAIVGSSFLFLAIVIGYPSVAYAGGSGTCNCSGCPAHVGGFADSCSDYSCYGDNSCDPDCGCGSTNFPYCACS